MPATAASAASATRWFGRNYWPALYSDGNFIQALRGAGRLEGRSHMEYRGYISGLIRINAANGTFAGTVAGIRDVIYYYSRDFPIMIGSVPRYQ